MNQQPCLRAAAVPAGLEIPPADWQQTPPSVQTLGVAMLKRLEALAARLRQDSSTSQRPPSADSPYKKARKSLGTSSPRQAGGQPGHPGQRQRLLTPTDTCVLTPPQGACGNTALVGMRPYATQQVIALPPMQMEVPHFVVPQAWCPLGAQWTKAQVPREHTAGYGPRVTALLGEIAGTHGPGRRTLQTLCASVLPVPLSLGAIQKRLDRVVHAIAPHYEAIARQARRAPINDSDDTPWFLPSTRHWLWGMAHETVVFSMIHPHRSKDAFAALIDDWAGMLGSGGYGVYHTWVARRQTCLAHLIRTARSVKETCRLQAQSTSPVLVDAVTNLFREQPPDLAWLRQQ